MTDSDLCIREFEAADLESLQQIRAAAFEPVFRSFRETVGAQISAIALASEEADQTELLARLCGTDSPEKVYVALLNGKVVGFVSIALDEKNRIGEIGLNAVHPDQAGQGIGTSLYEFALDEMKRAGMGVAVVATGGDPSHAPARRAYEKAGFGPSIPSIEMYCLLS